MIMSIHRSDVRIFGLLLVAFLVTLVLYFGLSAANVEGKIMGLNISIAGPIASFVALILVFKLIGLFTMGMEELPVSNRSPRKLSKSELVNELDRLELNAKRIDRRQKELKKMLEALKQDQEFVAAARAGGIRLATRGGGPE